MGYIKCPICDLNYIRDDETMCPVCAGKSSASKRGVKLMPTGDTIILKQPVRHNGRAIFFVFQNKEYEKEFSKGYISAPYYAKGGMIPHHWQRLELVKKGDIILHGVVGHILAISEAEGSCYDFTYSDGSKGRKINCKYYSLNRPLLTENYRKEIVHYCSGAEYQPFNKHGTGNQGYLFDIRREMAIIFIKEIVDRNPKLKVEQFIKDTLN